MSIYFTFLFTTFKPIYLLPENLYIHLVKYKQSPYEITLEFPFYFTTYTN